MREDSNSNHFVCNSIGFNHKNSHVTSISGRIKKLKRNYHPKATASFYHAILISFFNNLNWWHVWIHCEPLLQCAAVVWIYAQSCTCALGNVNLSTLLSIICAVCTGPFTYHVYYVCVHRWLCVYMYNICCGKATPKYAWGNIHRSFFCRRASNLESQQSRWQKGIRERTEYAYETL